MRLHFDVVGGRLEVTNVDGGPSRVLGNFGNLDRARLIVFLREKIDSGCDVDFTSSSSMLRGQENGWPDPDPESFVRTCIKEAKRKR